MRYFKKLFPIIFGAAALLCLAASAFAERDTEPNVSAAGAVLINADTGSVIYEHNAYEQRAMASTTKIMTALLTAEAGDLDERFTADSYAIKVEGTSMGLREGDIVTRRALLYGMLLPSGNDAANAAAVNVGGSMGEFVKLMNKKAAALGLKDTHFANPSGLDAQGHYTTAYDLAMLTRAALENPVFAEICKCSSARVEFGNPPYMRTLSNSNKMLWQYEGCVGVKTGFTDNARRCLVTAAEKNGIRLIAVTLSDANDWADHRAMLDYGFSQVKLTEIVLPSPIVIPVAGGSEDRVTLRLSEKITYPLSEEETRTLSIQINTEPFLYGGFEEGKTVGTACVYLNGEYVCCTELVTAKAVAIDNEMGFLEKLWCFLRRLFF